MNEDQVKYARDLATVSHAVIKLVGLIFTLPAIYSLFDGSFRQFSFSFFFLIDLARFVDQDLRSMVTQVLAIPLAPELPTPNARKTCPLATWVLQMQRLPANVLALAKGMLFDARSRANSERRVRRDR